MLPGVLICEGGAGVAEISSGLIGVITRPMVREPCLRAEYFEIVTKPIKVKRFEYIEMNVIFEKRKAFLGNLPK